MLMYFPWRWPAKGRNISDF